MTATSNIYELYKQKKSVTKNIHINQYLHATPPYLGHVPDSERHVTVGQERHPPTPVMVGSCAPIVDQDFLRSTCYGARGLVEVHLHPNQPVIFLAEKGFHQAVILVSKRNDGELETSC